MGNSPVVPKTPQPMATKFGVDDDVENIYPCAQFHYDPIRVFAPLPPLPTRTGPYSVLGGGGLILATPYNQTPPPPCTDFQRLLRTTAQWHCGDVLYK